MNFFDRRKSTRRQEDLTLQPPASSRVEVELHKTATVEAVQKAKQTNKHLQDLLVEDGFTLKIYLAAGGKLHDEKGDK